MSCALEVWVVIVFFFKQKAAYEVSACLVGSEMCFRGNLDTPLYAAHVSCKTPPNTNTEHLRKFGSGLVAILPIHTESREVERS